jgi:hypothetical protein
MRRLVGRAGFFAGLARSFAGAFFAPFRLLATATLRGGPFQSDSRS